jgi:branched-chain amino acid aminotransferase
VKCCNYLNNILAKLEAIRAGVDDALMLDTHGFVAELSGTNIFIAKKGKLLTPYPYSCLNGITRATVIDLARQNGIDTSESNITLAEVYTADECFATGTAAEIAPVVEVNGRTIGDGNKGPITSRITEWFAALVTTTGTQI